MSPLVRPGFIAGVIALALVASSVAAVNVRHEARKRFIELQGLNRARDELNIVWRQLQIERSTWATHARIEQLARDRLDMVVPATADVEIVKP